MTGAQLLALARQYLGDAVAPYLWPDDFLVGALNRAEQEAATRTLCLFDDSTAAITQITLANGTADYAQDARVLRIEGIHLNGKLLTQVDPDDLPRLVGAEWATHTGVPTHWFSNGSRLTLYPLPDSTVAGDKIYLSVYRQPAQAFTTLTSPEIDAYQHRALIHWACYEALQVIDADNARADMAMPHLAQFEQVFGPVVSWRVQLHQRRSPKTLSLTGRPYGRSRITRDSEDW